MPTTSLPSIATTIKCPPDLPHAFLRLALTVSLKTSTATLLSNALVRSVIRWIVNPVFVTLRQATMAGSNVIDGRR